MKLLSVLILILFSLPVYSATKDEIIKHAKFLYEMSSIASQKRDAYCLGQASTNRITDKNKKLLMSLNLSLQQLQETLLHLQWKHMEICTKESDNNLLMARDKYIAVLKHYEINYKDDDDIHDDLLHFMAAKEHYELWLNYRKLPPEIIKALDQIEQLQRLFSAKPDFIFWEK